MELERIDTLNNDTADKDTGVSLTRVGSLNAPKETLPSDVEIPNYKKPEIENTVIETGDLENAMRVSKGNLEWSLLKTKGISPDVAAKVNKLVNITKMPKDTVQRNVAKVEGIAEAKNVINMLTERDDKGNFKYPYTLSWLSNPEKMELAKDDVEGLRNIEHHILNNSSWINKSWYQLKQGTKSLVRSGFAGIQATQELINDSIKEDGVLIKGMLSSPVLRPLAMVQLALGEENRQGMIDSYKDARKSDLLRPGKALDETGFSKYAYDFVEMLPQLAGTIGSAGLGGTLAGGTFIGSYIFGTTYGELSDQEVTPERAATAAFANATIQGALELIPLSKLMSAFKTTGTKNIIKSFLGAALAEGGTEFLQSFPEEATRIWGLAEKEGKDINEQVNLFVERLPQTAIQGLYEGLLVAPVALFGATGTIASNYIAERKLAKDIETQKALEAEVSKLNIKNRVPEQAEEFVDKALKNSEVSDTIYIPLDSVKAFFQDDMEAFNKFVDDLELQQDIEQSYTTGEDIPVNRARWTTYYSDSDIAKAISDDIRYSSDGITVNEQKTLEEDTKKTLEEAQELYRQEQEQNILPKQAQDMRNVLIAPKKLGGFGLKAKDADAKLSVFMAMARQISQESGETVEEWFNRVNPVLKVGSDVVFTNGEYFEQTDKNDPVRLPEGMDVNYSLDEIQYGGDELLAGLRSMYALELKLRAYEAATPDSMVEFYKKKTTDELEVLTDEISETVKKYYDKWLNEHKSGDTWAAEYLDYDGEKGMYSNPSEAFTNGVVGVVQSGSWDINVEQEILDRINEELVLEVPYEIDEVLKELEDYTSGDEIAGFKEQLDEGELDEDDIRDELRNRMIETEYDKIPYELTSGREVAEMLDNGGWNSEVGQIVQDIMETAGYEQWLSNFNGEVEAAIERITEQRQALEDAQSINQRVVAIDRALNETHVFGTMAQHMDLTNDDLAALSSIGDDIKDIKSLLKRGYNPDKFFQDKISQPRGAVFFTDAETVIHLFTKSAKTKEANMSTFLHETAHIFMRDIERIINVGGGSEQLQTDFNTLKEFAGGTLNRKGQERIAKGFEAYLMEGRAPSVALTNAFRRIRNWLVAIYKTIRSLDDVRINDQIRGVFDRVLASEEDINKAEEYYRAKRIAKSFFEDIPLTEEQRQRLDNLRTEARNKAVEIQTSRILRAHIKSLKGGMQSIVDLATAQIEELPIYKAIDDTINTGGFRPEDLEYYISAEDRLKLSRKHKGLVAKIDINKQTYDRLVAEYGGINPKTLTEDERRMFKENNATHVFRENGAGLDQVAEELISDNLLRVPMERNAYDYLMDLIFNKEAYDFDEGLFGGIYTLSIPEMAMEYGYQSEEAFLDALLEADTKKQAIDKRVKAIKDEKEQQIREIVEKDETVPGEEAYHNEARMSYLVEEARVLAQKRATEKGQPVKRYVMKAYNDAALEAIAYRSVREASNYSKYAYAEQRYTKQAYEAIEANDTEAAITAKENQLKSHSLVRASIIAKSNIKKIEARFKRIMNTKRGNIIGEYHDAIIQILGSYQFTDKKPIRPDKVNINNIINEIENGIDPVVLPDIIKDLNSGKNYKDLTVAQLQELDKGISILAARGRNIVRLGKDGAVTDKRFIVDQCVNTMKGRKGVKPLKRYKAFYDVAKKVRGILAETIHVQFDFKRADGYSNFGKEGFMGANEALFDAVNQKYVGMVKNFEKFNREHLNDISKKLGDIHTRLDTGRRGIDIEGVRMPSILKEVQQGWTSDMIISVALNMGNEGNLNTLLNGFEMTLDEAKKVAGVLTEAELNTIGDIWKALDTLFPAVDETHYKQNGFRLKKVEAKPITITSVDGKEVTLDGGYYPIKHDAELSRKIAGYTEKDILQNDILALHYRSKPRDSMTKERIGGNYPLDLSIRVMYKHVQDSIRYSSMAEVLTDVYKVINDKRYSNEYSRLMGNERYDIITPWLSNIARPEAIAGGATEYWMNKFQRLTSIQALGVNLLVMMKQTLSLTSAAQEMGWKDVAAGMAILAKNPVEGVKQVLEMSAFMRDRGAKVETEIAKQLDRFSPFSKKVKIPIVDKTITGKDLQDAAFATIRLGDIMGAYPTWLGKYNKILKETGDHDRAVKEADRLVSETQPVINEVFKNLWQMGGSKTTSAGKLLRWVTSPFTGWTMKFGSRSRTYWNGWREGKINTKDFTGHVINERLLPPIMAGLLTAALRDEEIDDWGMYLYELLSYQLSWIPGINQIPRALKYGSFSGVMELPAAKPVKLTVDAGAKGYGAIVGKKEFLDFVLALGHLTEYMTGVPALKAGKEIKNTAEKIMGGK